MRIVTHSFFISATKRWGAQMNTLRVRRFRAKSICLIFQYIQHRTENGNRSPHLGFQRMDNTEMGYGNNLSCGMCMIFA